MGQHTVSGATVGASSRVDAGRPLRILVPAGLAQLLLLAAAGWWPGATLPFPTLPFLGAAFLVYFGASLRLDGSAAHGSGSAAHGGGSAGRDRSACATPWLIGTIWLFALLFRAVLLPLDPVLSDDVYRYLWDGHVQLQGINPYLHPPADPALESIRTAWHFRINHPEVSTIYPPVAQVVFRVAAFLGLVIGSGVLALKLFWIASEAGAALLLARVARRTGRSEPRVLLLFLWSPLLIVETAWSGHMEALGLLWLALLLWMAAQSAQDQRVGSASGQAASATPGIRRIASAAGAGVAAGFAALTKVAPAAAFPPLARRLGPPFAVAFFLTVALLFLPFIDAGTRLWTGLRTYGEHWQANPGLFLVFDALLPGGRLPRLAVAAGVLAVAGWTTWRSFGPERALFWILGTGLMLSPTLHPWYVLWILPFAALRGSVPWLLLSGLVFAGYWGAGLYQATGIWPEPPWVRALIWLPFFALLVHGAVFAPRKEAEAEDSHAEVAGRE